MTAAADAQPFLACPGGTSSWARPSRSVMALASPALTAAPDDPLINTPKVRLSKDSAFNPTPDSTRAALAANEADFTGYTAGGYTPTFAGAVNMSTNVVARLANVIAIAGTADPFIANTVYGYWLDDGTNVVLAERFANGAVAAFGSTGDYLAIHLAFALPLLQTVPQV